MFIYASIRLFRTSLVNFATTSNVRFTKASLVYQERRNRIYISKYSDFGTNQKSINLLDNFN